MKIDKMRDTSHSGSPNSKLADLTLLAALVGVVIILIVSMINMRDVRRLSARVTQLETLATAPTPDGSALNKVYTVDVGTAPMKGPATAAVTVVTFSDFECPFCLSVTPTLKQLEATYKDSVRFAWKHLPLTSIHARALSAAVAAEAARNQGKFWEYHDKLFANQQQLESDDLKRYAQDLELDLTRFDHDREDPALRKKVEADMAEAGALMVKSTPTIFINGRLVRGAMPLETYSTIIEEELAKQTASRGDALPAAAEFLSLPAGTGQAGVNAFLDALALEFGVMRCTASRGLCGVRHYVDSQKGSGRDHRIDVLTPNG